MEIVDAKCGTCGGCKKYGCCFLPKKYRSDICKDCEKTKVIVINHCGPKTQCVFYQRGEPCPHNCGGCALTPDDAMDILFERGGPGKVEHCDLCDIYHIVK